MNRSGMNLALAVLLGAASVGAAEGPIAHWKFDEGSGPTAFDSAGTFHGTLQNGAAFVAGGVSGGAIRTSIATNGFVNMGSSFPTFHNADFSIVCWAKTTETASMGLIGKHWTGFFNGYFTQFGTGSGYGALNKLSAYNGGSPANSPVSVTSVTDGQWHLTLNSRSLGVAYVGVDGAVEATAPAAASAPTGAAFVVGGLVNNGVPYGAFTGDVDEAQVYAFGITKSEELQFLHANPGKVLNRMVPDSFTIRFGRQDAGNNGSLAQPDGNPLRMCRFIVLNQSTAPVTVEVNGTSPVALPLFLEFQTVSRTSTSGSFTETLDMYDHVADAFDAVDARTFAISTNYDRRAVFGTGSLARYVGPGNALRARFRIRQTGPAASFSWCAEHDVAAWFVGR
jgi:hypothetical protein